MANMVLRFSVTSSGMSFQICGICGLRIIFNLVLNKLHDGVSDGKNFDIFSHFDAISK